MTALASAAPHGLSSGAGGQPGAGPALGMDQALDAAIHPLVTRTRDPRTAPGNRGVGFRYGALELLYAHRDARVSPIDTALIGWDLSELAIGVLGVLIICGEYSTGMVRSTFMAVPSRLPVLWAKVIVFATVTLVLTLPMSFIGFFGASAVLSAHYVNPSLATPGALRSVIAVPLFLTVLAVFTVALGALVRNIAGGIAIFAGIIFVIPGLVGVLSAGLRNAINPYLPSNAGMAVFTARPDPADHLLAPWAGFGVFCAYAAVLLIAAAFPLVRRDV